MATLKPTRVSTERFNYNAASNTFSAEMSDLTGLHMTRVYDDACDVGYTLVSVKTGREIVFAVEHEERDGEGELLWIDLRPANRSEWGAGTVRLYND